MTESERQRLKQRKADEDASTQNLIIVQMQLTEHIAGMTMVFS